MHTKPGLQLPVMAMSLVVPVAAFHNHLSGLVFFAAISGGELQEEADGLEEYLGQAEGKDIAGIDGMNSLGLKFPQFALRSQQTCTGRGSRIWSRSQGKRPNRRQRYRQQY